MINTKRQINICLTIAFAWTAILSGFVAQHALHDLSDERARARARDALRERVRKLEQRKRVRVHVNERGELEIEHDAPDDHEPSEASDKR